jgi:hypothetical protein
VSVFLSTAQSGTHCVCCWSRLKDFRELSPRTGSRLAGTVCTSRFSRLKRESQKVNHLVFCIFLCRVRGIISVSRIPMVSIIHCIIQERSSHTVDITIPKMPLPLPANAYTLMQDLSCRRSCNSAILYWYYVQYRASSALTNLHTVFYFANHNGIVYSLNKC